MTNHRFFHLVLTITMLAVLTTRAQELKFRSDGTFKIVQLTDLHLHGGKKAKSERVFTVIDTIMRAEQPDVVIITGDLIYGKPARKIYQRLLTTMADYGVPFVVLPGNHDHEQDIPMDEYCLMACQTPYCLNEPNEQGRIADMVLQVKSARTGHTATALYCLDSHDYSPLKTVKGYAWFTAEQVDWYRKQNSALKEDNKGKPVPAMAFYHIAVPEYAQAAQAGILCGTRGEAECAPNINSGMFTAMLEGGGMMANFVGHDHDNDYVARLHGIDLVYGRYSGADTVYNHLTPGARIIVLREGKVGYESYVRLIDGSVLQPYKKK